MIPYTDVEESIQVVGRYFYYLIRFAVLLIYVFAAVVWVTQIARITQEFL